MTARHCQPCALPATFVAFAILKRMGDASELSQESITTLLRAARSGSRSALDRVFEIVQGDLRKLAQSMLRNGWPKAGICGTELVNMACSRLLGRGGLEAQDRGHFLFLLGRAMHDVLVEEARRATAAIRGGGKPPIPLIEIPVEHGTTRLNVLDLHTALEEFRTIDPEAARVVELRYFAGLTIAQAAEATGRSFATVRGDCAYAKAWLGERLGEAADNSQHRPR